MYVYIYIYIYIYIHIHMYIPDWMFFLSHRVEVEPDVHGPRWKPATSWATMSARTLSLHVLLNVSWLNLRLVDTLLSHGPSRREAYVCWFSLIYICIDYVCICICYYICIYIYTYICIHTCIYLCMCIYIYIYHIYHYTYVYIYIYTHTRRSHKKEEEINKEKEKDKQKNIPEGRVPHPGRAQRRVGRHLQQALQTK